MLPADPQGRKERVGDVIVGEEFNERIQGPLFAKAGATHDYKHPDNPDDPPEPSPLQSARTGGSFPRGVIETVIEEIQKFVNSNGALVGMGIGTVAAAGGGGLLALIPAFLLILIILRELLEQFDEDIRLSEHMEIISAALLNTIDPNPLRRAAGLFTWQLIAYMAFKLQQGDDDFEAISYAVMDAHDYLDTSCNVNVDSVEVFFDAVDDRLIAFVDALIAFERMQEIQGKAFLGYAGLRFMARTRALIGMQKFDTTCSVEVSCLRDVSGSQEVVDYAVALARNPNIKGLLHWGQRNDYTMAEVERIYGDRALNPGGNLGLWRQALALVTDNGRLNGFSSEFSRRTGLEVVVPRIEAFSVTPSVAHVGDTATISWDCTNNPAGTLTRVQHTRPNSQVTPLIVLPLAGLHHFPLDQVGTHLVTFSAVYRFNDVERLDKRTAYISVS